MNDVESLSHTKWECKYHVVWIPKYRKKNFTGQHFWARGYFVSTVGTDEETIRENIRQQEQEDRRLDQMTMFEG